MAGARKGKEERKSGARATLGEKEKEAALPFPFPVSPIFPNFSLPLVNFAEPSGGNEKERGKTGKTLL